MMAKKFDKTDWIIVAVGVLLAFIPDPTDVIDAATPIAEVVGTLIALWYRRRK